MMALLKHLRSYRDSRGRMRHYFRRPGQPNIPLRAVRAAATSFCKPTGRHWPAAR
jgi:hypothetical protein